MVEPSVGSLAQLFLGILRYIDLTIRIAALHAGSSALAPGVYARIDVTNSSSRSCLRHESRGQSNKECQGEKRKYESRHRLLQQNEERKASTIIPPPVDWQSRSEFLQY
jgi:hypothetical protein